MLLRARFRNSSVVSPLSLQSFNLLTVLSDMNDSSFSFSNTNSVVRSDTFFEGVAFAASRISFTAASADINALSSDETGKTSV